MKIETFTEDNNTITTIELETRTIVIVKDPTGGVKVLDNTSKLTNNKLLKTLPWAVRATVLMLAGK